MLRDRSNAEVRADFAAGFMPLDSLAGIWGFLAGNGRRLLQTSLPRVEGGLPPWDGTFVWLIPLLGLGLIWLLGRARTRPFGLAVVGFYLVFLAASALRVFPMGVPRGTGPYRHLRVTRGNLSSDGRPPMCDRFSAEGNPVSGGYGRGNDRPCAVVTSSRAVQRYAECCTNRLRYGERAA